MLGIAVSLVVTLADAGRPRAVRLARLGAVRRSGSPRSLGGGAGFAAFGAAIGAAAREVRASSLLAFMVSLPIAFLSLVPSGTVSGSPTTPSRSSPRSSPSTPRCAPSRARSRPGGPASGRLSATSRSSWSRTSPWRGLRCGGSPSGDPRDEAPRTGAAARADGRSALESRRELPRHAHAPPAPHEGAPRARPRDRAAAGAPRPAAVRGRGRGRARAGRVDARGRALLDLRAGRRGRRDRSPPGVEGRDPVRDPVRRRTSRPRAPTTTRASCRWRCARSRRPTPTSL